VAIAVAMAVSANPTFLIFLKNGGVCDRARRMSFFMCFNFLVIG